MQVFMQYGALGGIVVALLWFARSAIQRERDRADKAEARNEQLNELIRTEVIPVLTRATEGLLRMTEVLREQRGR